MVTNYTLLLTLEGRWRTANPDGCEVIELRKLAAEGKRARQRKLGI